jgi:uncharacterized circularly permuted ATP-grasp superfamily protein/uncharacterized alpha-E superfamily protein
MQRGMKLPALDPWLRGYPRAEGRFDELRTADGSLRPAWARFMATIAGRDPREVAQSFARLEREVRDHGITYNVYADPKGADRPWEVDPLPFLIGAEEWREIEAGIEQRAELLDRVLADLYGPQQLLRDGTVAAPAVFGHSGFLQPMQGIAPVGGRHLFFYAADLGRSPDGRWWVVADRTQAPSGAGYALENRLVVSRAFAAPFRDLQVHHLAEFFAAARDALLAWAPKPEPGEGAPLVALLTPGPYNETYFEHALLARYLGFTLVEGSDLVVRNGRLWLKAVDGLKRVHALVRRQDDEYCDPLELRSDSALGVPGLVDCVRRGSVFIANALGSGVIESGALLGYLPRVCERWLGEPLKLPNVATWWMGEPAAFDDAWRQLDRVLIKPIDRAVRDGVRPSAVFGADLRSAEREALRERVAADPARYVAQEWVHLSQGPVVERSGMALGGRTVGLRVFAVATPRGWRVMPGGLARVAGGGDARVVAMQRGGRSKDAWVLGDAPLSASLSLLTTRVQPSDLVLAQASLSSRAAENLFWFGRYAERCDHAARLLRVTLGTRLADRPADPPALAALRALLARAGLVEVGGDLDKALTHAATHADGRLACDLRLLAHVAFTLRERLSADHWRTLHGLPAKVALAHDDGPPDLPAVGAALDSLITAMVTVSGFMLDGMTRSAGWRFLSIGRRVERLVNLCNVVLAAVSTGRTGGIDWLLDLCDSGVTFRSRYPVAPEWLPVLHLLVCDDSNPRAVAFQVKGLLDFVGKLEGRYGRVMPTGLAAAARDLDSLGLHDLDPDRPRLAEVLTGLRNAGMALSDDLGARFFSHAAPRSVVPLSAG